MSEVISSSSSPVVKSKDNSYSSYPVPSQPCIISSKEYAYMRSGDSIVVPPGHYVISLSSNACITVSGKAYICQSILSVPTIFNLN